MTLREGRPLPAARTGLGGRPEQARGEAPETALRPPLSAGRHVPLPRSPCGLWTRGGECRGRSGPCPL